MFDDVFDRKVNVHYNNNTSHKKAIYSFIHSHFLPIQSVSQVSSAVQGRTGGIPQGLIFRLYQFQLGICTI